MNHLNKFESFKDTVITFTGKRNRSHEIMVTLSPDYRLIKIENNSPIKFPFSKG